MSTNGTERRNRLRKIAEQTLKVIEDGSYTPPNSESSVPYNLRVKINSMTTGTRYYAAESLLSSWSSSSISYTSPLPTEISLLEVSSIEGVHLLFNALHSQGIHDKVGILNFASAKKPGGGVSVLLLQLEESITDRVIQFINGAQAQEESLARSSTLYPSLMTTTAQQFYAAHKRDPKGGYYSHAMIYSPGVIFFRDDAGGYTEPVEADMLISAAVNAGMVRNTLHGRVAGQKEEAKIEAAMRERMARLLFLFSQRGVKNLVLGSFGTGVFRYIIPSF